MCCFFFYFFFVSFLFIVGTYLLFKSNSYNLNIHNVYAVCLNGLLADLAGANLLYDISVMCFNLVSITQGVSLKLYTHSKVRKSSISHFHTIRFNAIQLVYNNICWICWSCWLDG